MNMKTRIGNGGQGMAGAAGLGPVAALGIRVVQGNPGCHDQKAPLEHIENEYTKSESK